MSLGLGNIVVQQKRELFSPSVIGANNGTSLSGTNVVLGNDTGLTSARLLSNREIPLNNFALDFTHVGSGGTARMRISSAQFQYNHNINLPGAIQFVAPLASYSTNTGAGGETALAYRIGFATNHEAVLMVSNANIAAPLGCLPGTTLMSRGAIAGTMYVSSEGTLHIRTGNALPAFATDNLTLDATTTQLQKDVQFVNNTNRAGASRVCLRNTSTGRAEFITGYNGNFTSGTGQTVTVVDGIITNVV